MQLFYKFILSFAYLIVLPTSVWAQKRAVHSPKMTLPKSVGMFSIDQRSYVSQASGYSETGQLIPHSKKFNRTLTASDLKADNPQVAQLVDELNKYQSSDATAESLGDSLVFGEIKADVEASLSVRVLKLAYGLSKRLTLFAGVPYQDTTIRTSIYLEGTNNAHAIRDQLGELAYEELQEGLERAASTTSADVKNSIYSLGYEPVDEWQHAGVGDVRLGAMYGDIMRVNRRTSYEWMLRPILVVPSGYVERPELLTDVSHGKGYYSLGLGTGHGIYYRNVSLVADMTVYKNLAATREMRVPENEEKLIDAERQTGVTVDPGMTYETILKSGVSWSTYWQAGLAFGYTKHGKDTYSGGIEGNYDALSAGTDSEELYNEYSLSFSTIKAFKRKKFVYPFVVSIMQHKPITAKNTYRNDFWQLSLTGFFGAS